MKSVIHASFANYPMLDWSLLAKSVQHYEKLGFQNIETPWAIPEQYTAQTKPFTDQSFVLDNEKFEHQPHELVGSAEQGFRYLITTGNLALGKYCSVSPCFRVDTYDALHLPWFIKLELCHLVEQYEDAELALTHMLHQCAAWFDQNGKECEIVTIGETYDLNVNGIEVGSYGIRHTEGQVYVYGTGLALPRFTIANK